MKVLDNGVYRDMTPEEETELQSHAPDPQAESASLKAELASYDYIGVKLAMGVATREEYAEQIAYTETLRQRIRELEGSP